MRRGISVALAFGLFVALTAGAPVSAAPVPGTSCQVFPSDNVWNTDISKLPVDPHSKTWLKSMHAGRTLLHPDFGGRPYGFPFDIVDNATPTTSIHFHYASESDKAPYPFTSSTWIEKGSDRHALMINSDTCTLYELFAADWNGGDPKAGSGAIFDLGSNALRPDGWTSADAAGLPIFPGLVRYDEVASGHIDHAIRVTFDQTRRAFIHPATHYASDSCNVNLPPMGLRFRLKPSYSLSGFSGQALVVARALKQYGMINADNGSNFFITGATDSRWNDNNLNQLKDIPGSAVQVVKSKASPIVASDC
jgi:hypothetical protein